MKTLSTVAAVLLAATPVQAGRVVVENNVVWSMGADREEESRFTVYTTPEGSHSFTSRFTVDEHSGELELQGTIYPSSPDWFFVHERDKFGESEIASGQFIPLGAYIDGQVQKNIITTPNTTDWYLGVRFGSPDDPFTKDNYGWINIGNRNRFGYYYLTYFWGSAVAYNTDSIVIGGTEIPEPADLLIWNQLGPGIFGYETAANWTPSQTPTADTDVLFPLDGNVDVVPFSTSVAQRHLQ